MSVVWQLKRGRTWTDPALAIPCPNCPAGQGEPCKRKHGEPTREMIAEALGFVLQVQAPLLEAAE